MIRSLCATLLVLAFVPRGAAAQRSPADSALIQQLATMHAAARRAAANRDSASFARYVTDDFAFVHSTGGRDDAARYLAFASRVVPDSSWVVRPSEFIITPDVVVRNGTTANRIAGRGADTYHGVDVFVRQNGTWRWAFHQTTRVPRKPTPATVDTTILDAYAGTYIDAGGGAGYTVTRQQDSLIATPVSGQGRSVLRPYTDASFFIEGLPATAVFMRDASGRVAFLEMHRREAVARFARTPAAVSADTRSDLSDVELRNLRHIQRIHEPGRGLVRRFRESGLLADSAEWWVAGPRDVLPFAGSWRGIAGIAEFEKQLGATMRYDKVEIREYLVSGNDVVAIFLGEGVARATGKPFRGEIVRMYSFANDKVVRVRNYYDTDAYVRAVRGEQ